MSPTRQEKQELLRWVEGLPKREGAVGYENVLVKAAELYNNTPADLGTTISASVEHFQSTLRKLMREHRKSLQEGQMPDADLIETAMQKCLSASLLRMWVYASEYYQRWSIPDFAASLDDDSLQSFLHDLGA